MGDPHAVRYIWSLFAKKSGIKLLNDDSIRSKAGRPVPEKDRVLNYKQKVLEQSVSRGVCILVQALNVSISYSLELCWLQYYIKGGKKI